MSVDADADLILAGVGLYYCYGFRPKHSKILNDVNRIRWSMGWHSGAKNADFAVDDDCDDDDDCPLSIQVHLQPLLTHLPLTDLN